LPTTSVHGLHVDYTDVGNGLPVVFVPSLDGSKEWFRCQAAGLSGFCRVISYDLRTAKDCPDYSLDMLRDDLAGLIAVLRLRSPVVVGYSFGALITLRLAATRPQSCALLVLCSAGPAYNDLNDDDLASHLTLPRVARRRWFSKFLGEKRSIRNEDDSETTTKELAALSSPPDRATLSARLKIARETDLTPVLEEVSVPTLVLAGALEERFVLAGCQTICERIPDSPLEVMEDADQYYFHTRYDLFNDILCEYIRRRLREL